MSEAEIIALLLNQGGKSAANTTHLLATLGNGNMANGLQNFAGYHVAKGNVMGNLKFLKGVGVGAISVLGLGMMLFGIKEMVQMIQEDRKDKVEFRQKELQLLAGVNSVMEKNEEEGEE